MNTNKDSAVQCLIYASYALSTICTIFIFLAIFKGSWNMALIALDSFLIMGAVLISAYIIESCDDYSDVPLLVNIVCCIVLAVEYFIMIVGWGIFNIVRYVFIFPGIFVSFVVDSCYTTFLKKGDENNDKNE